MAQRITAIIVNYNAGAYLRRCVESILQSTLDIEVVVVDNASKDQSLAMLNGLPRVRVIRSLVNKGFASGCNIGLYNNESDYYLFVNPDCLFEINSIEALLSTMLADNSVGMVGGRLVDPDGTEQGGGRRAIPTPWRSFVRAFGLYRFADRWPRLFFDFYLHKQPLPDEPIEVEAISGACMLVRKEAMNDVGAWDEGYFLHCEDLDFSINLHRKGWKILFVPTAIVIHEKGVCGYSRPIFVEWHKHKGMIRFYKKFFHHQYPGIFMWLVVLGVWMRFTAVACFHLWRRIRAKWQ